MSKEIFCEKELMTNGMMQALGLARTAAEVGEVPVGAVVMGPDGSILAQAHNHVETWQDPSAHAEMLAMRQAVALRGGQKLVDCTLFVTLEPCPMCAAAITHFRVGRVVFGAYDPKGGGMEHGPRVPYRPETLHKPEVIGGVREQECAALLKDFFTTLRCQKHTNKT